MGFMGMLFVKGEGLADACCAIGTRVRGKTDIRYGVVNDGLISKQRFASNQPDLRDLECGRYRSAVEEEC